MVSVTHVYKNRIRVLSSARVGTTPNKTFTGSKKINLPVGGSMLDASVDSAG